MIESIAVHFTDIDSLITSFRTGLVTDERFRSSLHTKLDAANKLFKPSMHQLDVYYVKYFEDQFSKYSEFALGKTVSSQSSAALSPEPPVKAIIADAVEVLPEFRINKN